MFVRFQVQNGDEWFWVVSWISVNNIPVPQFLNIEREVSSQDSCRCNAEWGIRGQIIYSNLPFLALPIKGVCPVSGDHLSHNLVFRVFFYVPTKQHPLSSISIYFREGLPSSKQGSWLSLLWPVAEKGGVKRRFTCHGTKKSHFLIYFAFSYICASYFSKQNAWQLGY